MGIVDGRLKDRTLTFSSSKQWEDATVYWTGALGKGKHSVYLRGPNANTWGCQDQWGDLDIEDLLVLLGAYGSSKASGDVNKSGKVDIEDLLVLLGSYGKSKKC